MPKKISDLISKSTLNDADSFPVSDGVAGADRRIAAQDLLNALDGATTGYVDNKSSFSLEENNQVDFYNLASQKDNSQAFFKKLSDSDLHFLLPIEGNVMQLIRMSKNTNDDYVQIGEVSIVETENFGKNYPVDSRTGTFVDSNPPYSYASATGSKLFFDFYGTGLKFYTCTDDRGGVWELTINGDTDNKITISTYSSTFTPNVIHDVFDGYPAQNISVVAEFVGDDPSNPPSGGSGTSRGWYQTYFTTDPSTTDGPFIAIDNSKRVTSTVVNSLVGFSNKEFAIRVRQSGSTNTHEWLPQHGTNGTCFGTVEVTIDGKNSSEYEITGNDIQYDWFVPFNICNFYQNMVGRNNADNVDLCRIHSSMNVNAEGVSLNQSFRYLQETDISAGYVNMIPIDRNFGTILLDSKINDYNVSLSDGSENPLVPKENIKSLAVLSSLTNLQNYVFATLFEDNLDTFLYNKTKYRAFGGEEKRFWWQARSTDDLSKVYPQIFIGETVPTGFTHRAKMKFTIGKIRNAISVLTS